MKKGHVLLTRLQSFRLGFMDSLLIVFLYAMFLPSVVLRMPTLHPDTTRSAKAFFDSSLFFPSPCFLLLDVLFKYLSMRWVILRCECLVMTKHALRDILVHFYSFNSKWAIYGPIKKICTLFFSHFFLYNLDTKISNLLGEKLITGLSSTNLQKVLYQNSEQRQPQPLFTFLMLKTSLGISRTSPSPESKEWTLWIWNPNLKIEIPLHLHWWDLCQLHVFRLHNKETSMKRRLTCHCSEAKNECHKLVMELWRALPQRIQKDMPFNFYTHWSHVLKLSFMRIFFFCLVCLVLW